MVKKYKLFLELLSDAVIASDKGYGAIIDTDVIFDEVGLPYIPAKRLKGVLRESAEILTNIFKLSKIDFNINIYDIFGCQGNVSLDAEAKFKVPNLYIEDYEKTRDFFSMLFSIELKNSANTNNSSENNKFKILKEDVIDFFTRTRMQTAIDSELGKTKKHSLRSIRVINKNTVFSNFFQIDEKHINELIYICSATKNIGSKRNRGFGEVKVYIKDDKGQEIKPVPLFN